MNGTSRTAELENILSEVLDEWDQEELTSVGRSSYVDREDVQSDLEDLFERARAILERSDDWEDGALDF